jgi:hypothetical protein
LLKIPLPLDGANLAPLLQGGTSLNRSSIFWHFPGYLDGPVPQGRDATFRTRPVTVIRQGDWKLHLFHEEWLWDGGREKPYPETMPSQINPKFDPNAVPKGGKKKGKKKD